MTLDRIEILGMHVFGHHGANPGEQDIAQPFDIDLLLDVDLRAARASDALADTVDYAALHALVGGIVARERYALLERLGQTILDAVLADSRIRHARVRIAKPRLLAGATPAVTLSADAS